MVMDRSVPVTWAEPDFSAISSGDGLQHMARHLDQFGTDLLRREQAGATGDHQRTAGEGTPAIGRAIGVAVDDLDELRIDPDFIGDDLRQRGAQSLAVRRGADTRLDKAGGIDGEVNTFPSPA